MNVRSSELSKRRFRRFFSSHRLIEAGQKIVLSEAETRHLAQTLRLKEGDSCLVTDGQGREAEACIESISLKTTVLKVGTIQHCPTTEASMIPICLYVACPKKGKMDDLIEKAQEIGIEEVVPMETSRTEIKFKKEKLASIYARWERIAREAAKQSGSSTLVQIRPVMSFEQVLEKVQDTEGLIFHPSAKAISLRQWSQLREKEKKFSSRIHALIGPEGGFSEAEIQQAQKKSLTAISLGKNILKVDTAFIVIAGAFRTLMMKE